jgi:NAD-dependent SIR2 family protein deacetylase
MGNTENDLASDEALREEILREMQYAIENPGASDQFEALKMIEEKASEFGISIIDRSKHPKNLNFVDAIIEGDYYGFSSPIAFETKNVIDAYSINHRITEFLYRLEQESEIRSVLFVILDAKGEVDWVSIQESIIDFRERFDIKIVNFEDFTGFSVPKKVNKKIYNALGSVHGQFTSKFDISLYTDKFFRDEYTESILDSISKNRLVLCLGAGVSSSAKVPGWNDLIERMWSKAVRGRSPLTSVSDKDIQFELSSLVGDSALIKARTLASIANLGLFDKIRTELYSAYSEESSLISALADFVKEKSNQNGLSHIITYNYDNLLEQALEMRSAEFSTVFEDFDEARENCMEIYHVHGFLPPISATLESRHKKSIVFSEDSYHQQMSQVYSWPNLTMFESFSNNCCVFVGCSMTDPNVRRLLELSQQRRPGARHWVILRAPEFKENSSDLNVIRSRIVNIQMKTLLSLGVRVIWIKSYDEIPQLIRKWLN